MKFAFSTNAYRQYSLEESITSIKNAGYSALEIMCDTPHAYPPLTDEKILQIQNKLENDKMSISNLNGFMLCAIQDFHHPSWIEDSIEFRNRRIEHTKNCIILADKLNVDMIIMGKIGIGKSDSSIGNVSQQVVNLTTKPVVFID